MTHFFGPLAAVIVAAASLDAQALDPGGVSDSFSSLYPARTKTFIKASSDPDDRPQAASRGNDDGFSGTNQVESYRYRRGGKELAVLVDVAGQAGFMGCFFRNYWSGAFGQALIPLEENRTQFFVDGDLTFDRRLSDYFRSPLDASGQQPPFAGFFTGNRAGGSVTHTPIAWNDSFRIEVFENAFSNAARFHKVCGTIIDPDRPITAPDLAAWENVARLSALGRWPHATPRSSESRPFHLPPGGGTATVSFQGPATLLELTATVDRHAAFEHLWARFTWDGQSTPAVDLPLRFLGGMTQPPFKFAQRAVLFANNADDRITCYFPMHFATEARLEIINQGPKPVRLKLTTALGLGVHPEPWGYFTALYQHGVTQTGVPFRGPELRGVRGMLRGMMLETSADSTGRIRDGLDLMHLEGDLLVRINGTSGDDHTFAASETSIGKWGWYGTPSDVPFSSDTSFQSGISLRFADPGFLQTMRLQGSTFVFDPIHFTTGIDVLLEHGVQNASNAIYGLATFLYLRHEPAREVVLDLDVGDVDAEARALVQFGEARSYRLTGSFFRDPFYGDPALTDEVREIDGFYRFTVDRVTKAPKGYWGYGIALRVDRPRVRDGDVLDVDVFVDSAYAGRIHCATSNALYRWKEGGELELALPVRLTDRKRRFKVEIAPRPGSAPVAIGNIKVYGYTVE